VTGGWKKLHDEELHNLYSLSSIIRMIKQRRIKWAGHIAHMGEKRNAYRILVANPEGIRALIRPICTWENNKMNLREIEWGNIDWVDLDQDRDHW
jgi:hypothetical protein